MEEKIHQELELLRRRFPDLVYKDRWIWVPRYQLTEGWNPANVSVAFFIRDGYPGGLSVIHKSAKQLRDFMEFWHAICASIG